MTLKLNGSSSGSVSIDAPASTTGGADVALKLPVADGSSGQALTTNASGQLAFSSIDNTPAFIVRKSADQSADSNNTWYKVTWDVEDKDTDNAFASDKFTVPSGKGGIYFLSCQVALTNQSESAELATRVYKNGSQFATPYGGYSYSGGAGDFIHVGHLTHLFDLDAADYLEIYIWHGSGGTNVIESDYTCWAMFKLAGTS